MAFSVRPKDRVFLGIGLVLAVMLVGGILSAIFQHEPTKAAAAATPTTPPAAEPRNPVADRAMYKDCQKKLDIISRRTGVLRSYQLHGDYGTVEVRDSYYPQSFEGKEDLNMVMYCVFTEGRWDKSVNYIEYQDFRNHKEVARWSRYTGFTVE